MKIAIMQPYLFPYIGYFQLINAVDKFVVYDNIKLSKKRWFHRNNILVNGKKTLFTLPLKKDSDYLNVVDRYLADNSKTHITKIINQIKNSYKNAPHFDLVFPLIQGVLRYGNTNLFEYIHNSILMISRFLKIDTEIIVSSSIDIDHRLKSQDKVVAICKALSADVYINPIGGKELYEKGVFKNNGIKLQFLKSNISEYKQFDNKFIPSLSIIDTMMFNDVNNINKMLHGYQII